MSIGFRISQVVLTVFLSVASASGQTQSSKPNAPATSGATIELTATVSDKKDRVVTGLTKDNFEVLVDNLSVPIISSESQDGPLSVGFILDASTSSVDARKERETLESLQSFLLGFMALSNPGNEYFLLGFHREPQLLVDWTTNPRAIVTQLNIVKLGPATAFYDACYVAIDKVQQGRNSKRVLIVLSDGQDNKSEYRLKQVREALKESNVIFYSINFVSEYWGYMSQEMLNDLSSLTGGRAFHSGMSFDQGETRHSETAVVPPALEIIAYELRHQYSLLIPAPAAPGSVRRWHKVKIKVKPVDRDVKLKLRTREGFYLNQR